MKLRRLYVPPPWNQSGIIDLDPARSNYLSRVLRMRHDDQIEVFDGCGRAQMAAIDSLKTSAVTLRLGESVATMDESPLRIHLYQAVSRGERMDYTVQKAAELGVASITPVFSNRVEVKLKGSRLEKRMSHWHQVMASAAEQCGRAWITDLKDALSYDELIGLPVQHPSLLLHPDGGTALVEQPIEDQVSLAIGPEGGFTEFEVDGFNQAGWSNVLVGPRLLRTETASLVAAAILQSRFGDI